MWIPAAQALSALAERFGDLVWGLLFAEVQRATGDRNTESRPDWLGHEDVEEGGIWEEERSWRDPSAHKVRVTSQKWYRGDATKRAVIDVSAQLAAIILP